MGAEAQTWRVLKRELLAAGVKTERLTDRLVKSRPDVLWLDRYDGMTGLFELKVPGPRQKGLGIRPGQALWLWEWVSWGGHGALVVRHPGDSWSVYVPLPLVRWVRDIESETLPSPQWHWLTWPGGDALRKALRRGSAENWG